MTEKFNIHIENSRIKNIAGVDVFLDIMISDIVDKNPQAATHDIYEAIKLRVDNFMNQQGQTLIEERITTPIEKRIDYLPDKNK